MYNNIYLTLSSVEKGNVLFNNTLNTFYLWFYGVRHSSVVRAFTHGTMGRRIDPSWGGPIELFLVPASAAQLV